MLPWEWTHPNSSHQRNWKWERHRNSLTLYIECRLPSLFYKYLLLCISWSDSALIYCFEFSLFLHCFAVEAANDRNAFQIWILFHSIFFSIANSCKWYKFHECTRIAPIFSYAPGAVNILHIRYKERCISSCSTTQPNKMKTGKLVKYFANTQQNSTQSKPKPAHTAP